MNDPLDTAINYSREEEGIMFTVSREKMARRMDFLAVTLLMLLMAAFGALMYLGTPAAKAAPGQCSYGGSWGNGGGFCDYSPNSDGTFMHCESVYVMGWGGQNCFLVRPVPVEVDPRGWVPA